MENSKNLQLAKDYFERHPLSTECHITSDGRVFHTSGSADSFAATLKNKEVTPFQKSDVVAPEASEVSDIEVEAEEVEAPVVEAPVVEAPLVEAPVVEAPVVEAPLVEAPVVEAPVVETTPKIDLASFNPDAEGAYVTGKALLKQLGITLESYTKENVFAAIVKAQTETQNQIKE